MSGPMKRIVRPVLLLVLALFQSTPALARSDDLMQSEIEAQIAGSDKLRGTRIEIHVEQRLVILTGEVRLYEQRLIADRIAWTTMGVFEVDNEIRVVPKQPLSDTDIERKIKAIVSGDEHFRAAGVLVKVNNGEVSLEGSFLNFRGPSLLKHKVAEIEGVVDIKIRAAFLARSGGPEGGTGVKPQISSR